MSTRPAVRVNDQVRGSRDTRHLELESDGDPIRITPSDRLSPGTLEGPSVMKKLRLHEEILLLALKDEEGNDLLRHELAVCRGWRSSR